jgi:tellurite resistance protein
MGALVAAHRLSRLEVAHPAQSRPPQDPAHRGRRDACLLGDVFAALLLTSQRDDLLDDDLRRRTVQPMWTGRAVSKAGHTLGREATDPFEHRLEAHPDRQRYLAWRNSLGGHSHDPLSTKRR